MVSVSIPTQVPPLSSLNYVLWPEMYPDIKLFPPQVAFGQSVLPQETQLG